MRTDENEYIKDIFQLIKSLLNFCEYDLSINKGLANDIIGEAVAKEQGNAFNMKYKMDLDLGFGELRVNFNDWMFRIDESTIINKATINKFGLNIATVTLFFRKKN